MTTDSKGSTRTVLTLSRLGAVARKEWIQLRRDPRSLALAFLLPAILLLLFGYAITTDLENIRMAVLDRDHTAKSREFIAAFGQSGYFDVAMTLNETADAASVIDRGQVRAVMIVPERFAADLNAGRPAPVELVLDGSDAKTATMVLGYATSIARTFSNTVILGAVERRPVLTAETRVWFNETLDGHAMVVPGLIAVIMSIISAMLTSLTIAREWERGTMEQLAATPVSRAEVVVGKILPYLGIALIDVAVAVVAAIYLFEVPFRGSLALLSLATVIFLVGVLGLGTLLSAVLKSQLLATQASIFATYMPALLLSGFFYSLSNMPSFLQLVSRAIPARYFVSIARGLFLRGIGFDVIWPSLLGLSCYALIVVGLSIRNFRKELA